MKKALIHDGRVTQVAQEMFPVHPVLLWVDCPDDCEPNGWIYADGRCVMPPPAAVDQSRVKAMLVDAVQARLDLEARTRGYDGILSLSSYASSSHPRFSAEGRAGLDWRDAVWGYCHAVLADVEAGTRPIPTVDALMAELPVMQWPA